MASNSPKPRTNYYCTNKPEHGSYNCMFTHSPNPESTDVRRMICPHLQAGGCRDSDRCYFAHVEKTDIDWSYDDPLISYDYPLEEVKTKKLLHCQACKSPFPLDLIKLHLLNCPKRGIYEHDPAVIPSLSAFCELCKQLTIYKKTGDCFGLLYSCNHAFCYGCLIKKRRKKPDALENEEGQDESVYGHGLFNPQNIGVSKFYVPNKFKKSRQPTAPITRINTGASNQQQIDANGFCVPNMFNQSMQPIAPGTSVITTFNLPQIDANGFCIPNMFNQSIQPTTPITRLNTGTSFVHQIGANGFRPPDIYYSKLPSAYITRFNNRTSNSKSEFGIKNVTQNQIMTTVGPTGYTCPKCQVSSEFIIQSNIWTTDIEEKNNLIELHRLKRKQIDCVRFKRCGKCDNGKSCHFLHSALYYILHTKMHRV